MITQQRLKQVINYDPEAGLFTWRERKGNRTKKGGLAGGPNEYGYIQICIDGKLYKAHRLAWMYVYGFMPSGMIDHINRKTGDNRISNLREVTNEQNQQNSGLRIDSTSGVRGVTWNGRRSKWEARIKAGIHRKHLGYFESIEQACAARLAAESKYFTHNIEESK